MTAEERLARIRVKVERANRHIAELRAATTEFLASNPYKHATKKTETGDLVYYLAEVREPPMSLSAIAGDVFQNLRAALDHLVYELVALGSGTEGPHTHAAFPILDTAAEYEVEAPRRLRGVRDEAKEAVAALRPYRGGNDVLWRLHKLNIIDKHRKLVLVGTRVTSWNLGRGLMSMMREQMEKAGRPLPDGVGMDIWMRLSREEQGFPLKAGHELLIVKAKDVKHYTREQFRYDIAIGEPGVVEGEPLAETVHQTATLVDSIVEDFRTLLD